MQRQWGDENSAEGGQQGSKQKEGEMRQAIAGDHEAQRDERDEGEEEPGHENDLEQFAFEQATKIKKAQAERRGDELEDAGKKEDGRDNQVNVVAHSGKIAAALMIQVRPKSSMKKDWI